MKELSKEEKAKAYDKVREKIAIRFGSNVADEIFSQFEMSEDERIRKALIDFFNKGAENGAQTNGIYDRDILAWLEKQGEKTEPIEGFNTEFERQVSYLIASSINKDYEYTAGYVKWVADALLNYAKQEIKKQGEQKLPIEKLPSEMKTVGESLGFTTQEDCDRYNQMVTDLIMSDDDKGEQKPIVPKFKIGDWLVENMPNNYARFIQILEVVNVYGIERYKISRDIHNDEDVVECRFIENNYHSFTIQDIKDGDILVYGKEKRPFISKGLIDKLRPEFPVAYCGINTLNNFIITAGKSWWTDKKVQPATKEQRDLLFQRIEENGWKWDTYKKKLIKLINKTY